MAEGQMRNTFDMVGRIMIGRKTDKFTPYETRVFSSGWTNRILKFNVLSGANRHMMEIRGGCWKDGHGDVYTYSKASVDSDGNETSGEKIQIPWAERNLPENIKRVASWKKFIIDTEIPGRREKLKSVVETIENGTVTDEQLKEVGASSADDAKALLEQSSKRKHEFITAYDFAAYAFELMSDEAVKNMKFRVMGDIVISEYQGKFYRNFIPTRILRADDKSEPYSHGNVCLYFNKNSLDDSNISGGKYYVYAYLFSYDNKRKKEIPCPVAVTIPVANGDAQKEKLAQILARNFSIKPADGSLWKELGVKVDMIDGAQPVAVSEDMLSETEQDLLAIGEITMEDIARERNGRQVYGDVVREWQVTGFAMGYLSGARATAYVDENFIIANDAAEINEGLIDTFDIESPSYTPRKARAALADYV